MTVLENTISMIKVTPKTDLLKIQKFNKELSKRQEFEAVDEEIGRFLKPMTEEDFLQDMKTAEVQFAHGEYQEMGEAIDEICRELGI